MANQIRQTTPSLNSISLLIAAHCSTIRRKAKRLDVQELSAMFDDLVRELNPTGSSLKTYLHPLNEIVTVLNSTLPSPLIDVCSHYLFTIVRNTIRDLLQQLCANRELGVKEAYILRNCVLLIHYIVEKINDVLRILHWITDASFMDALANSLRLIKKISRKDQNQRAVKQITRLLDMFCIIQERLPLDFHQTFFVRLLEPTLKCLLSSNYVKLFQNLKPNAEKMTEKEKLYLIKCPYFLTTYNGPHIEQTVEKVLAKMLPHYASILDQHVKNIKEWRRPMMRAMHNLIITIIYAEGYFSSYTKTDAFRSLVNHLLNILAEPTLVDKIEAKSKNIETLLIDATLVVFNVLVYEPNALDYVKSRKPTSIFRRLTKTPYETIVLNAYMMLAYTLDNTSIKNSQDNLVELLSTTINLLRKTLENRFQTNNNDRENLDRNILQLTEILKGLAQYEQIRNEIIKQNLLIFLIDSYKKLHGLAKQTLLETLWKLSFDNRIVQQLRQNTQFVSLLETIPKSGNDNIPQQVLRRSNSHTSIRNSQSTALMETTNYQIQKIADGLLWKIVKEPQFRQKLQTNTQQKSKYDIMISFSYADKDIVNKIYQILANEGYTVWTDRDYNNGLAMETVAEAIENSEFILICMSDSYQRDNHCQAEAEYALSTKRSFIPLVIHHGYKPDGWLTSIIYNNNNNYIDFGISDFKVASDLLLREIKQRQPRKDTTNVRSTTQTPVSNVRNPPGAMINNNKTHTPVQPSNLTGAPNSLMSSFPAVNINRPQQQSQQQAPTMSTLRPSMPTGILAVSPIIINQQQQQQQQRVPNQPTPTSAHNSASARVSTPVHRQQTPSLQPLSTLVAPAASPATVPNVPTQQQQREVLVYFASRESTPSSASSEPTVIGLKQEQQKLTKRPPKPTVYANGPANTTTTANKQQQQTSVQANPQSATPVHGPSTIGHIINQQQTQALIRNATKSPATNAIPSNASVNTVKKQEQQSINPTIQPSLGGNVSSATPINGVSVQQQLQRPPSSANSRSPTPAALTTTSQTNGREQTQLPDQYINRKTENATYRNISTNEWKNNDVLDYLFDLHLYPMMPLCESMSGKAFVRLFRMCQKKPSRLYDQLNEELRLRFKGSTLSMGVYTQFLIEMDNLVGPVADQLPPAPSSTPKITERVIIKPSVTRQLLPTQPSPEPSSHASVSSRLSSTTTSVSGLSGSTLSQGARIVERAVYRPASNVGRPYNFIVDSVEEPAVLLNQVQRYGDQLLSLDETARRHRQLIS